ncbi:MAG: hypothetical protein HKN94_14110 [Acidimicrobiales bacterium]|nr:hypothetical protein [Acidimicrobiales bacterium]RZV48073.1 MAG: hypothetical protein EX269_03110 [Acidimicrobiales bacterium]
MFSFLRLRQPWRWLPYSVRLRWARLRWVVVRYRVGARGLWLAVVVLLFVTWANSTRAATLARDQWGATEVVVVADRALAVGDLLTPASIRLGSRPALMVPSDAVLEPPLDGTLATSLQPGEILTARHLAATRAQSLTLRSTDRAIGVPIDASTPPLVAGDLVDLLLIEVGPASGQRAEVSEAVVLAVGDTSATVSVAESDVDAIASVLVDGAIVVALRTPG